MGETENFNISLNAGIESRRLNPFRKITLKNVFEAIDNKIISDDLKAILKSKAESYPFQALKTFLQNLDKHVAQENKKIHHKDPQDELEFPE